MQPARQTISSLPRCAVARSDGRRRLGSAGELHAAAHLQRLGFAIVARNVRTAQGEIDIVAASANTIVFAEIKTRTLRGPPGSAVAAAHQIGARQRVRIRRAAVAWLSAAGAGRPRARELRFDAIGVSVARDGRLIEIEHLEAAF